MQAGAITSYFDVAQITLYAFWLFFAGLIYYLHRENKREGYPLESDRSDRVTVQGFPPVPSPKTYILPHGGTVMSPRVEPAQPINAMPTARWPGAPFAPVGNPLLAGVGPGAWANRADTPDVGFEDGNPRIVPLSAATSYFLEGRDPDPRGMTVIGADRLIAGRVVELWVDRSEVVIRYLEVALAAGGRSVLLPITSARIDEKRGVIKVRSLLAAQFADVPAYKTPGQITLLEEDKITAYYAGGNLYATKARAEPLL